MKNVKLTQLTGFEDLPGDRRYLICRLCSDASGATKDVKILRTSKTSHVKSQGHQQANQEQDSRISAVSQNDSPPPQAAQLSFVDLLGSSDKGATMQIRPPSPVTDPFSSSIQYHGEFFDADGTPIVFSAGESWGQAEDAQRADVEKQFDRLALLPGHSLFGQFSDDNSNDPDSVDGAFSAALERMGESKYDQKDLNLTQTAQGLMMIPTARKKGKSSGLRKRINKIGSLTDHVLCVYIGSRFDRC
jgi:hypothetical protein